MTVRISSYSPQFIIQHLPFKHPSFEASSSRKRSGIKKERKDRLNDRNRQTDRKEGVKDRQQEDILNKEYRKGNKIVELQTKCPDIVTCLNFSIKSHQSISRRFYLAATKLENITIGLK